MKNDRLFKWITILLITVWLGLFSLVPSLFILVSSLLDPSKASLGFSSVTLTNYQKVLLNPLYFKVFWQSLLLALSCATLCLMIAYPFTYFLSQTSYRYRNLLVSLILVPFWSSSLIRTYAIISILKAKGLLNTILLKMGLIHEPVQLLHTQIAVLIGLVYDLLPFMIIPLYISFLKIDRLYIQAARDLGASNAIVFYRLILPLTIPGILNGALLVILPAMTLFYISDVLGGAKSLLLGNLIQQQFLNGQWGIGGAVSILLLTLFGLILIVGNRIQKSETNYQSIL
jgi:spermidine/putrescine transport system permease protein